MEHIGYGHMIWKLSAKIWVLGFNESSNRPKNGKPIPIRAYPENGKLHQRKEKKDTKKVQ